MYVTLPGTLGTPSQPGLGQFDLSEYALPGGVGIPAPAPGGWSRWIDVGVRTTSDILRSRYGQPPAGTYIQTREGGVIYRQPEGTTPFGVPPFSIGPSGAGQWVPWIVGALAVVFVVSSIARRR